MKVTKAWNVRMAIRNLDEDDQRKVLDWIDRLESWQTNEPLRKLMEPTQEKGIYALDTPDDLRIFFRPDPAKEEIEVVDIIRPSFYKHLMKASG